MKLDVTSSVKYFIIFYGLICSCLSTKGQFTESFAPFPFDSGWPVETIEIARQDLRADPQVVSKIFLPMIGTTTEVAINSDTHGNWIILPEAGIKIWTIELSAEDNGGIGLYFDMFQPGEYGRLFLYDDLDQLYGAYTVLSNPNEGAFAIHPIQTQTLRLQFETSIHSTDYNISINEIGLLFPSKSGLGFGTSGSCQVNINCEEGAEWQQQKRGVVRIIVKQGSAQFYCSGSLINNALADRFPYLLTANHCGEYSSTTDYKQWVFAFNYESPDCDKPLWEPAIVSLTGASLVAKAVSGTDQGSDFKLLKLLQEVPLSYNAYFNGWSLQEAIGETGVGIHHPDGDLKKISSYSTTPASSNYGYISDDPSAMYWRVNWSATENGHGVTEGGSSGSPLFDNNGRIIGLLTGGTSSCNNLTGYDFYGKFSSSWTDNANDAIHQLKPWLDPNDSGITFLNGIGSDTLYVEAGFEAERREIAINQYVNFENTSQGKIEQYEWYFPGGKPENSIQKEPEQILYQQYGDYDVRLIAHGTQYIDTLYRKAYISVLPFLFPNPADGSFTMSFGVDLTDEPEISIHDLSGRQVAFYARRTGSQLQIQLYNPVKGAYIIRINDSLVEKNLKFIIAY